MTNLDLTLVQDFSNNIEVPIKLYVNNVIDFKQNDGKVYSIQYGDKVNEGLSFDRASKMLGIAIMGDLLMAGKLA